MSGAGGMLRRSIPFWVALLVLLLADCRSAAPPALEPVPTARATLAGKVTGPQGIGPVAGRQVVAVDVTTGARYATKTHLSGGFTLLVPPGRYRLEVALARAESIVEEPGVLDLAPGALVRDADVVLGGAGVADEP